MIRIYPNQSLEVGFSPSARQHGGNFTNQNTNSPEPISAGSGSIPKSVAGSGISPSAVNQGNGVDLKNPQTSFHDPNLDAANERSKKLNDTGQSGVRKDNEDIKNITDKNLYNFSLRHIPKSLGGSGISPSAFQGSVPAGYYSYLEEQSAPSQLIENIPIQKGSNSAGFEKLSTFPYGEVQPFDGEVQALLKQIHSPASFPQLPVTSESSSFYFLSDRMNGHPLKDGSSITQSKTDQKTRGLAAPPFDVNLFKRDFPILQERVNGRPLIWLDNAATTQKPKQVIDRISYFYEHENSNIHRAAHELAARATDAYENARKKVQAFLNAGSVNEIVFVRGATEGINLIAKSWGEQNLQAGDEIIVSHLEHHANIVPWQQLVKKNGIKIKVIPVDDDGQLLLGEYAKLLSPRTKLVSVTQVSNALGTITPVKQIIDMAHHAGAKALIDGAQSVSHMRVDVRSLNCDWFVFSGHKIFGPTGYRCRIWQRNLLNETQPWQGGGNMIADVTFEHTKFQNAPSRYEAGTGNIADAVGLGAALNYVSRIGIDLISQYEHYLLLYATRLLKEIPGLHLIGTAPDKASVLSFVFDGFRTEEVGAALNKEGIAVRAGHHCAQPILRRFGLETTVRPSLAFYNTCADIDALINALYKLRSKAQGSTSQFSLNSCLMSLSNNIFDTRLSVMSLSSYTCCLKNDKYFPSIKLSNSLFFSGAI